MANEFSDLKYIEQIRKKLWYGQEYGQVAVMIGAGFSRNSEKVSSEIPPFPLWSDIAKLMYNSLYPKDGTLQAQHKISGNEALGLATEYEAVFGRPALDDFLIKSIPDTSYYPGKLHQLLLSLPWSDVYASNYDTLLERTLPLVYDRKYDIILTMADIPGSMKPRLVKLHGSLPSHRPFIITEEDYRTYPIKFAPFVNMVQQALMENIFCLIGFSGDDPNFLHWSGWVRDNLGESTPPIYLIGILNISTSQRKVLENRKIIPIDLSPLFPKTECPDEDLRHSRAIEWFLWFLIEGAPLNIMHWPESKPAVIISLKPSEGLPKIPELELSLIQEKMIPDFGRSLEMEDLRQNYESWKQTRLKYPGWIVAPKENREILWSNTKDWVEQILFNIDKLQPPENLFLLYELNWRLEKTLTPLFIHWVEVFTKTLENFNPYPVLINIDKAIIRPDKEEYRNLDWNVIANRWVELAFTLAHEAREDLDEKRFTLWMERLKKVIYQRKEWQSKWYYEKCMFELFRFDQKKLRKTLNQWPETMEIPQWEAKRAAILAELGELKEAKKIAERALSQIRLHQRAGYINYNLLSLEGWLMILLHALKINEWTEEREFVGYYRDRWEKLNNYRCNPWTEIELLNLKLEQPIPKPAPPMEIIRGFDPGYVTTSHHLLHSGYSIEPILPAFNLLRMLEEGGVPLKCGMVGMSKSAVNAAKYIEPYAPLWSINTLIRTGNEKVINDWFDRLRVATLTQEEVTRLASIFENAWIQCIEDLESNPKDINIGLPTLSQRLFKLLSELISRLCFRFPIDKLDELFNIAISLYRFHVFSRHHIFHDSISAIFKRLLFTLPQTKVFEKMPGLLSLPIPAFEDFRVALPQRWPEPFEYIKWLDNSNLPEEFDRSDWSEPIEKLIRIIDTGLPEARERAIVRLAKLHEINALTPQEKEKFAKALWSRIDPLKELPADTGLYDSAFLSLPESEQGIAKEKLRKYLLSVDVPGLVRHSFNSEGKKTKTYPQPNIPNREYLYTVIYSAVPLFFYDNAEKERFVNWSTDEATQLCNKFVSWWDKEKKELQDKKGDSILGEYLKEHFQMITPVLCKVILPRLGNSDENTQRDVKRLLQEMEGEGFCMLSTQPGLLFVGSAEYENIVFKMRNGLNSLKQELVREAVKGVYNWLVYSSKWGLPSPPSDLLKELINRIAIRRQPGLDIAIEYMSVITKLLPEILDKPQIDSLCLALEDLIKETELPDRQIRLEAVELPITIPIGERIKYKELSAHLAYALYLLFRKNNKLVPEILNKWIEICEKDQLPEIKKIWEQISAVPK